MSATERSKAFGLADVDKRSLEKKSCYSLAVVHSWMTAGIVPKPVSKGHLLSEVVSQSTPYTEKAEARLRKTECLIKYWKLSADALLFVSSGLVLESTASLLQSWHSVNFVQEVCVLKCSYLGKITAGHQLCSPASGSFPPCY